MPFTTANGTLAIAAGLASVGQVGPGAIKFAAAIAGGVDQWIHGIPVITTDTGAVGVGTGAIQLAVPPQVFIQPLTLGFASEDILGPMAPLTIRGIATGLSNGLAQATVYSQHPGVGSGACIVTFGPFSAVPPMLQSFASAGLNTPGSLKTARAIGVGLDSAFSVFSTQSPIAGAPGPSPAAGKGFGFVI